MVKGVQWPSPEIHRIDFARRIAEVAIVLEHDGVGDYAKRACLGKSATWTSYNKPAVILRRYPEYMDYAL